MGGDNQPTSAAKSTARSRIWARVGLLALLCAAVALVVSNLPGCQGYLTNYKDRVRHASQGRGPLVIAVVSSSSAENLTWQGAELAADQINRRGGVLNGRQIQLRNLDDKGSLPVAEKLARGLAEDREVAAVVGHVYSGVAVPVSIIYGAAGLLFISTGATDPQLNLTPNPLSMRVVPNDGDTARAMADLARKLGLNNLVVFFQRGLYHSLYGKGLAGYFAAFADDYDLEVLHIRSFFPWQEDLRPMLVPLRKETINGIVVIGFMPQAGLLINQARGLSMRATVLGSDSLDYPDLTKLPEKAAEGVIVASFFHPGLERAATREFVTRFQQVYRQAPDAEAANAYDAVNLIAAAARSAESTVPLEMANALIYLENVPGAASVYNFSPDGDPVGRWIWFKEVKDGKFAFLPGEYQPQDPAHLEDASSPKNVGPAK